MNRNAKNRRFHTASRSLALTARRLARAAKAAFAVASDMGLLRRFQREEAGSFVTIAGLAMPIFIGFVGLGTEVGLWLNKHQAQQGAADSAAVSAATAYYASNSVNINLQAKAITASYNLVDGANGVTVTTNQPPKSGSYTDPTKYPGAVEVIVQQTQERLFSALWSTQPMSISARAVALVTGGKGCMLALDPHANKSVYISGSTVVTLNGCSLLDNSDDGTALYVAGSGSLSALSVESVGGVYGSNITVEDGINHLDSPAPDPYANRTMPTPSSSTCVDLPKNGTPQPGTFYCGLDLKGSVTLSAGTYFIGGGNPNSPSSPAGLTVNAQATVTNEPGGVTLIFTQSNGIYGTAKINGGATIDLTAPTSGPMTGIVIFGDRNMPSDTLFKFNGGANQNFAGAIYIPNAPIEFFGGDSAKTPCFQLIGRTLTFSGNSQFTINCQNMGTQAIGSAQAKLVE